MGDADVNSRKIDLRGRRFGDLLAISEDRSANSVYWTCLCKCGAKVVRRGGDLLRRERSGRHQSCGCARKRTRQDGAIRCSRCREWKSPDRFCPDPGSSTGRHGYCKDCQLSWRESNRPLLVALTNAWAKANPERHQEMVRAYRRKNSQKFASREAFRRARKIMATPSWADLSAIQRIYADAKAKGLSVDHIVPLRSDLVCGLHVANNLQLLTKSANSRKSNRIWPNMP